MPLGAPGNRLTRDQRVDKIARCLAAGDWAADPSAFMLALETLPLDAPSSAILAALSGDYV